MTEHMTPAQYLEQAKPAKKGRYPRAPKADRTLDGETFDSKREMLRWQNLRIKQMAGLISQLTRKKSYPIEINGGFYTKYTPDAEYVTATGQQVFEDVKSSGTRKDPAYRLRKKAFELYYGVQVTEVLHP
jgi:hypothetical protein